MSHHFDNIYIVTNTKVSQVIFSNFLNPFNGCFFGITVGTNVELVKILPNFKAMQSFLVTWYQSITESAFVFKVAVILLILVYDALNVSSRTRYLLFGGILFVWFDVLEITCWYYASFTGFLNLTQTPPSSILVFA